MTNSKIVSGRICCFGLLILLVQAMAAGIFLLPIVPAAIQAPANLSGPSLARTASTILLVWDKSPDQGVVAYDIYQDGKLAGSTRHLCHTATNLVANTTYKFAVRARNKEGNASAESNLIQATTKPGGTVFNVKDYGAKGDGKSKDTRAIQAAIKACTPGSTVLVPPGIYLVDQFELKGDMTFDLVAGATLQFRGRADGKFSSAMVSLPGPDGEVQKRCGALISAIHADRLTITGGGVINGNGATWWPHKDLPRPRLLMIVASADVFVQGITLEDPPTWNTHLLYVDRAVFSEVRFLKVSTAHGSNGDGLDPDSSRDVLIVGCQFGNQDDSIAIKSGSVKPGQSGRQRSSENITIRDCLFDGTLAHGSHPLGFAVGSETCGGVRHVLLKDCEFRNVASVANLKANRERAGAVVEDIRIEDCTYTNNEFPDEPWNRAPLTIDLFYYRDYGPPDSVAPLASTTPVFRDIHFKNIVIENPKGRFAYLCGLVEQPVRGITFENITGSAKHGLHGQNLDGIELRNVPVKSEDGPSFTWINVENRTVFPAAAEEGTSINP